ncbi:MAG: sulfatase [Planctomycetota bacterium]|nr:MAG: sulfatase [Planctomycetota bacterium]
MNARGVITWTVAYVAAIGVPPSWASAIAGGKPNIVVIVGDDMGYADLGVHGCRDIATPHLDALASAGVRCTNGYVSGPYCSPTRAGLLTGRYQTRFGHEFNPGAGLRAQTAGGRRQRRADEAGGAVTSFGLPLSETTMADRLRAAGYVTGLVGKWHLGSEPQFHPRRRGFDEFFGFLGGAHPYVAGEGPAILRGDTAVDEKEYLTDALAREAVQFIERYRDEPFFLYLAFNAVHTPMQADEARLAKFQSIPDETRRTYAAMMSAMDDAVGRVAATVAQTGLEENTLVFFISDNGGPRLRSTSVNGSDNSPLRGSKRTTLEGGVRVPFFVKWPARLKAGVYDKPVIQLDILPTVLAAAGIEAPADARFDGVDLLPYLVGENPAPPHEALYWRLGPQMAIRQGDWKLVRYNPAIDGEPGRATAAKLYNLAEDIGEQHDLAAAMPEKASELQAAWDACNASNVVPLWRDDGGRRRNRGNRPAPALTN